MGAAAVVQEVQGSLLLPQQDFLHSPQGVAADVEVEAVGNDVDDVDDDVVNLPHPHSQTLTVTSEGSLTSAKEETCNKTRNTYPYLNSFLYDYTSLAIKNGYHTQHEVFFLITYK